MLRDNTSSLPDPGLPVNRSSTIHADSARRRAPGVRPPVVWIQAPEVAGDAPRFREAYRRVSEPYPDVIEYRAASSCPTWNDISAEGKQYLESRGYTENVYNEGRCIHRWIDPWEIRAGDRIGMFTIQGITGTGPQGPLCTLWVGALAVQRFFTCDTPGDWLAHLLCDCGRELDRNMWYLCTRLPLMCGSPCLKIVHRLSTQEVY